MNHQTIAPHVPLAELEEARTHWGRLMAVGVLMVLLGTVGVVSSGLLTLASVVFVGWLLVLCGIGLVLHAFSAGRWSGLFLQLLGGVLNLVVGLAMIVQPLAGATALTLLLAVSFLVQGLFRLAIALTTPIDGRGWLIVSALATVILGAMVWAQWPSSSLWVIGLFVGIDLLFYGWWLISLAWMVRSAPAAKV